jgi:hypothetical protein
MAARHQAQLAPYLDAEGEVIEEMFADYDDARITTAIEASDQLDTVIARLTNLVGAAASGAFTLTFAGRERHDGQGPTSFVVNATSLDDAARVLAQHPDFHDWYQADAAYCEQGADIVYLPEHSHAGLPSRGEFADLRGEYRPITSLAISTLLSPSPPPGPLIGLQSAPAPASSAARTPL